MKTKKHTKADAARAQKSGGLVDHVVKEVMEAGAYPIFASMIDKPRNALNKSERPPSRIGRNG